MTGKGLLLCNQTPAGEFKEDDRCGRGDVQGIEAPGHGNGKKLIAAFLHQRPDAPALTTDDQTAGSRKIRGIDRVRSRIGHGTEYPVAAFFQALQGFGDILHAADAEMTRSRSEERRVGKECRSRWSPYH